MATLEKGIEQAFVRAMKRRGLTALKLNLQGNTGWPDRLVVLSHGRVCFVELKRPGGKLRPLQEARFAELGRAGHAVGCFDDAAAAERFVEICEAGALPPNYREVLRG
jgi:hypothetical protein